MGVFDPSALFGLSRRSLCNLNAVSIDVGVKFGGIEEDPVSDFNVGDFPILDVYSDGMRRQSKSLCGLRNIQQLIMYRGTHAAKIAPLATGA